MRKISFILSVLFCQLVSADHLCIIDSSSYIKIMSRISGDDSFIVVANGYNKSEYSDAIINDFDSESLISNIEFKGDKSFYGNADSELKAVIRYTKNNFGGFIPTSADFTFKKDRYFQNSVFKDVKCFQF